MHLVLLLHLYNLDLFSLYSSISNNMNLQKYHTVGNSSIFVLFDFYCV
jgi:hypothetical protein